jgi:hypothetical protein
MRWKKRGLIYGPSGDSEWARHSALQPTPFIRNSDIRVFVGMRDDDGVSRVGFVDVSAADPARVLRVSEKPVLDVGQAGAFDESGVVPCAVVEHQGELHLFYAGYQLGRKVKFYVFGGLAVSRDGGETFERLSRVPICDRTDSELFFRVIHTMAAAGARGTAAAILSTRTRKDTNTRATTSATRSLGTVYNWRRITRYAWTCAAESIASGDPTS